MDFLLSLYVDFLLFVVENESVAEFGSVAEFESVFTEVLSTYEAFNAKVAKSRKGHDEHKRMFEIVKDLQPASFDLRNAIDASELLVADDLWPFPKYREILLAHNLALINQKISVYYFDLFIKINF